MALINCPECGKEASDKAEKCPNCGYPFANLSNEAEMPGETPKENTEETTREKTEENAAAETPKDKERKWIIPVAVIGAIVIVAGLLTAIVLKTIDRAELNSGNEKTAIGTSNTETVNTQSKKDGSFEEILNADVQDAIDSITKEYESLASEIDDYKSYKANADKVAEWYTYCEEQSAQLYAQIAADSYEQYQKIANTGLKDYKEWHDMLTDSYKVWDDAMQDYYKAWNRLYEDAYGLFNDVVSDGYDVVSYDESSDTWEDMYDLHSDSWEDMYDSYSDAWEDLYDFYGEVFDEFYNGDDDVKSVYEKIYKKE